MGNLQVKDVPEDVHDELRRRAAARGWTVRDYLLDLIMRDQRRPTREEWLARLHRLPMIEASGADLVHEVRQERAQHLGSRSQ